MSSTPTLAKIAVSAANTADSTAQTCQEEKEIGLMGGFLGRGRYADRHSGALALRANPESRSCGARFRVRCFASPRNDADTSIPIFRQHRERGVLDAFVDQRARLFRRGFAVDRAVLDLAVMHLAGFIGEALADIIGGLDDVVAQFLE